MVVRKGIRVRDFNRWIDSYLDLRLKMHHQPSSVESAKRDLGLFSRFCKQLRYRVITGKTVVEFFGWVKTVRNNGSGAINRKRASICTYLKHLRLLAVEGSRDFPIDDIPRARDAYHGPVKTLEPDEVKRLLRSIGTRSDTGFRDFVLFYMIYSLGLRLGEALGIDLGDIDRGHRTVLIHGKGRRERLLPIPPELYRVLRRWFERREALPNSESSSALFLSRKGNRLSARAAQEALGRAVKKSAPFTLDKITPHTLRHCFASHALETEDNVVVLQALLGHASTKSTELYLHPSMRLQRQAINNHVATDILVRLRRKGLGTLKQKGKKTNAA